ncbi:NUDIX domain-containing protein [Paenibacillus lactis]|uniref:NUDIX hydrolase n=1 Tax=Paenibacillus lactis 154 TaxID=743719 RepID=G4HEQ0_9BACL|nr:NUDIX domain-containing protein [Paenibacillus lactis]EHB65319.1 NUDIX hydrolase [Paenibacillus lactis 154]
MNRTVYKTEYYAVEVNDQHEIVVFDQLPESASVVALHEGCLLLVRQYREAVDEITWELPGGTVRPGEEAAAAARRELEEEAGIRCKDLSYMGSAYPMASLANRKVHYYFTDVLKPAGALDRRPDDDDVAAAWVPLRDVFRKVQQGGVDAMVGHGLLLGSLNGYFSIE